MDGLCQAICLQDTPNEKPDPHDLTKSKEIFFIYQICVYDMQILVFMCTSKKTRKNF